MSLYRIRVLGSGWIIHLISDTEPTIYDGALDAHIINQRDSDKILLMNWDEVLGITYREVDESDIIKSEKKEIDPKEIKKSGDGKQYVSLEYAKKLLK